MLEDVDEILKISKGGIIITVLKVTVLEGYFRILGTNKIGKGGTKVTLLKVTVVEDYLKKAAATV